MLKRALWVITGLIVVILIIIAIITCAQTFIVLSFCFTWIWGVLFVFYLLRKYKIKSEDKIAELLTLKKR